jgi:hypothetical protein
MRNRSSFRSIWFATAAVMVPFLYALVTNDTWEDYFITFRYSQNLIEGKGLVYNDGERVHGFTSPLGVLIPAFCYWITGQKSYVAALWLFRAISIFAFARAGLFLLRSMRQDPLDGPLPLLFVAALYLVEYKAVAFSINGMETAFMLLFLAWGFFLLIRDEPTRWADRGACWACLLWTRPDGFVYIAALAFANLVSPRNPRRTVAAGLFKSALLCAVLYLPWFLGAWLYYGSPVPNTIRAKYTYANSDLVPYLKAVLGALPLKSTLVGKLVYAPPYYGWHPGWPAWIGYFSLAASAFAALYWLLPVKDRTGRLASLCFTLLFVYHLIVPAIFPWYLPPLAVCGIVALVRGLFTLARLAFRYGRAADILASVPLAGIVACSAVSAGLASYQAKVRQEVIETDNRIAIGQWLRSRVRPDQRVYLEPLGYIGYFSHARMLDYPGLVSPQVVKLRREGYMDFFSPVFFLSPEWVVMRPSEAEQMPAFFVDNYVRVKTFDVHEELAHFPSVPGSGFLEADATYLVFMRK